MQMFMDESGDSTGFGPGGSSTFNIALVKVSDSRTIRRISKRFCAYQINAGWPKLIEVKASLLFGAKWNRNIPDAYKYKACGDKQILSLLDSLVRTEVRVDYLTIKKQNVVKNLQTAPAFVLYNYLSGKLLGFNLKRERHIKLHYDMKNKEAKPKLNFASYLTTTLYTESPFDDFQLEFFPCDSMTDYCIRVADFVSWSVFRNFESGDSRFLDVLKPKVEYGYAWYQGK